MSATPIGLIFALLTFVALVGNKRSWYPWLLASAMPFVQTSGLIISGSDISPFFITAIPAVLWCIAAVLTGKKLRFAGITAFIVVMFALSAVLLPTFFEGIPVLVPRGGIDEQVLAPGQLQLTLSNFAQAGYFALGAAVILHIANNPPRRPHFIAFGFGLGTALNTWALAALQFGLFFPQEFFRPVTEATFASFYGQSQRLRGIYAEPSYLATFAVTALAFFVFLLFRAQKRRGWILIAILANAAAAYLSFSGTAIASLAFLAAAIAIVYTTAFVAGRVKLPPLAVVVGCVVSIPVIFAMPAVIAYVGEFVTGKTGSSSGANREASNAFSWQILQDTYLLGSGLGSSRPSSFFFTMLSTVGVLGVVLYLVWLSRLLAPAVRNREFHPELWAVLAVIICKVIAEPNPSNPIMILCIAAAAAAASAPQPTEAREVAPSSTKQVKGAASRARVQ